MYDDTWSERRTKSAPYYIFVIFVQWKANFRHVYTTCINSPLNRREVRYLRHTGSSYCTPCHPCRCSRCCRSHEWNGPKYSRLSLKQPKLHLQYEMHLAIIASSCNKTAQRASSYYHHLAKLLQSDKQTWRSPTKIHPENSHTKSHRPLDNELFALHTVILTAKMWKTWRLQSTAHLMLIGLKLAHVTRSSREPSQQVTLPDKIPYKHVRVHAFKSTDGMVT